MDQTSLIRELKGEISSGRTVVITGTGVSLTTCDDLIEGFPVAGWIGHLNHGVWYCRREDVIDDVDTAILEKQIQSKRT
jgi:hypothetical protein